EASRAAHGEGRRQPAHPRDRRAPRRGLRGRPLLLSAQGPQVAAVVAVDVAGGHRGRGQAVRPDRRPRAQATPPARRRGAGDLALGGLETVARHAHPGSGDGRIGGADGMRDHCARDGTAAWWTTESVYSATVDLPIGDTSVEIAVRAEVPMSAENYRVHRRGNRYWPTTVRVELDDADLDLLPQTARELAQRLVDAADAADAIDNPDTDTCGHWAPCDCGGASAESHAGKEGPTDA